ncbi:MAG: hypothetical protein P8Z00_21150 [Anaerolineales bacterium]
MCIYSRDKTVADCFKFRKKIGLDIALEALKDYLRQPKRDVEGLLNFARLNRVEKIIRPYVGHAVSLSAVSLSAVSLSAVSLSTLSLSRIHAATVLLWRRASSAGFFRFLDADTFPTSELIAEVVGVIES